MHCLNNCVWINSNPLFHHIQQHGISAATGSRCGCVFSSRSSSTIQYVYCSFFIAVYMKILLALLWCGFLMAAVPSLSPPANQISRHSHPHNRHGSKRPTPASTNNATSTTTSASVDGVTHAPPLLQRPFADCDYFQNLVPDKLYDIYSPGYEAATVTDGNTSYAPNTQCRWLAVAPKEHTIRLQCEDVALPKVRICVCVRVSPAISFWYDFHPDNIRRCRRKTHTIRLNAEHGLPRRSPGN